MKLLKDRRFVISALIVVILLLSYFPAKPHINRLFDNRERAVMTRHGILLEEKIQSLARQKGTYPPPNEVKQLILSSGLISPHTKSPYDFTDNFTSISEVKDSQIAYGLGEYNSTTLDDKMAYVCMGIDLPRTNEGGASCQTLNLDAKTDARIKYILSCETNWLGFSTGCDKSFLQSL